MFNVVINVGCTIAYVMIFYTVRKRIKETTTVTNNTNTNRADIKLSIYGFIIVILLVIYTITLMLMMSNNYKVDPEKYNRSVQLWTGLNDVFRYVFCSMTINECSVLIRTL